MNSFTRVKPCLFFIVFSCLVLNSPQAGQVQQATLVRLAVLPAQTWGEGPPCGEFDEHGTRRDAPLFPTQPIQGVSSLQPLPGSNQWLALSDNGFGSKANSPDYLLRIYELVTPDPLKGSENDASVQVVSTLNLNDRNKKVPFLIVNENTTDRLLTGADFDPESMVLAPDGSMWIGDEFGPFLLHFDHDGTLLEPPIEIPNLRPDGRLSEEPLRSPQHPQVEALGTEPGASGLATVKSSGGIEGLAQLPNTEILLVHIEKAVLGDLDDLLRIYEFDSSTSRFTGAVFRYPLENPKHRVGELTAVDDRHLLVIERDSGEGESARFKRVFRIEIDRSSPTALVRKTELADLMNINDPQYIGSNAGNFTFPFATIESVLMVEPDTLLIANDNNFNSRGARGQGIANDTELIWIKLPSPVVPTNPTQGQLGSSR
jgi:glycerophosphoryl diester phosphodiesterase